MPATAARKGARVLLAAVGWTGLLVVMLLALDRWEDVHGWPVADSWYRLEQDGDRVRFGCQDFAPVSFTQRPQPGVERVLLLGGSSTFGYPERPRGEAELGAPRHGFAGAMARSLEQTWPGRFELVNVGINGGNAEDAVRMMRRAADWGLSAVILYDGHNEHMSTPARFRAGLWRFTLYRRFTTVAPRMTRAPGWVGPASYGGAAHDQAIVRRFRRSLMTLASLAEDQGLPLVIATQASNLVGLDPSWSTAGEADDLAALSAGTQAQARAAWERWPEAADAAWQVGRRSGQLQPLLAAVDHDGMPYRATAGINDTIRSVASQRGLILVDVASALQEAGMIGGEHFYDNVHPRPPTAARIGTALLDGLAQAGVLPGPAPAAVEGTLPPTEQIEADLRTALYWLRWAAIRSHDPGWRLAQAERQAQAVLLRQPGEPTAMAVAALVEAWRAGEQAEIPDTAVRDRLARVHPDIEARLVGPQ